MEPHSWSEVEEEDEEYEVGKQEEEEEGEEEEGEGKQEEEEGKQEEKTIWESWRRFENRSMELPLSVAPGLLLSTTLLLLLQDLPSTSTSIQRRPVGPQTTWMQPSSYLSPRFFSFASQFLPFAAVCSQDCEVSSSYRLIWKRQLQRPKTAPLLERQMSLFFWNEFFFIKFTASDVIVLLE